MNNLDEQYKTLLGHIMTNGKVKEDRTGTGTISVFDYTIRHKMEEGFPLLTTKKISIKNVITELLWFLGNHINDPKYKKFQLTNVKYLLDNKNYIWIGDCYKAYLKINKDSELKMSLKQFGDLLKTDDVFCGDYGNLGPVYTEQWRQKKDWKNRDWGSTKIKTHDQIMNMVNDLKNNPDSRRILVDCWEIFDLPDMVLPPCHYTFQCYTYEMSLNERIAEYCKSLQKDISYGKNLEHSFLDGLNFPKRKISLKFIMRSTDTFLGASYNLASYGLLLMLLAKETNMITDELIFSGGDVHLYKNHIDQAKLQMSRDSFKLPMMKLSDKSMFDMTLDDFELLNYESHPAIKAVLSN